MGAVVGIVVVVAEIPGRVAHGATRRNGGLVRVVVVGAENPGHRWYGCGDTEMNSEVSAMVAILTVSLDDDVSQRFHDVLNQVGLDAATAIQMLATQTARDQALPLRLAASRDGRAMDWLDEARAPWGQW